MKTGASVLVFGGRSEALKAKTKCIVITLYRKMIVKMATPCSPMIGHLKENEREWQSICQNRRASQYRKLF